MRRIRLSEPQKVILSLIPFPAIMLVVGLVLAWTQLGSRMLDGFRLSIFQLAMAVFFSLIIVLIGGDLELRLAKYIEFSGPVSISTSKNSMKRWIGILGAIVVIVPCLLLHLVFFWGGDKQALIRLAQTFTLAGLVFLIMLGTMFILASARRIASKRGS